MDEHRPEPMIHAVPWPYDGLRAVCGEAIDGINHTGHITLPEGDLRVCDDCAGVA